MNQSEGARRGTRAFHRVLVALAVGLTVAAAASLAAAMEPTRTYTAFGGGLEIFYPQGKHGQELSIAWNSGCTLWPATGPFTVTGGHFSFRYVQKAYGFAGKGTINGRTAVGQVKAWTARCNTGWVRFIAHRTGPTR